MLKIGIVEDEIEDLVRVIRNLLALDPTQYEFELVPILLSDPQRDTAETIAEKVRLDGEEPLRQMGKARTWPVIEQKGMLCPADEQHRAEILQYLAVRQVDAIISDSWIGKDTSLQYGFSEAAMKLAGVMLLDAAEQQEQWRGRCWMMTSYQRDVFDTLLESSGLAPERSGGWVPKKFNPLHRYLRKSLIIEATPGVCDKQLEQVIDECLARLSLTQHSNLSPQVADEDRFGELVGDSPQMLKVYEMIQKVSPRNVPVLILGDPGTGKEWAANMIHKKSRRADRPFVSVNCGAIPLHLMESELFGQEKGSFTGAIDTKPGLLEQAQDGTIFLNEIDRLDLMTQAKLLHALHEEKVSRISSSKWVPFNARVLAATSRDLEQAANTGEFRQDLFYRLSVVSIHLPPLKDRSEDIALICQNLIAKLAPTDNSRVRSIAPAALETLQRYPWPGNVPELEKVISQAIFHAGDREAIEPDNEAIVEIAKQVEAKSMPLSMEALHIQEEQMANVLNIPDSFLRNLSPDQVLERIKRKESIKTLPQWAKIIGVPDTVKLADLVIQWLHHLPSEDEASRYFGMTYTAWKGWVHRNRREIERKELSSAGGSNRN